ncbi:MAG: selenocysteine-specific translation elongation factor, partial [Firmicutes bacterium]|nr:selenocysteine-specific translation elongation factor [Bacillota bacterium]
DRLKEEQQRGITIELGFADMTAPDGTDIGIIDVPGHEKFIKNMLAGIGGIDIVLLVVASDEGVMPQTVEHLDIMRLLNIKKGIIVITKADLSDDDWLELVEDDIRTACRGTFLENAPAVRVSSYTGQGIEELRSMIFEMIPTLEEKNTDPNLLRIPADRVFTIAGFGTVITGTLTQGQIRQGQEVMIYPKGLTAKVRNLQVHGNMVETAYAGQRTAVNLSGIKKEDISRGDVVAAKNSMEPGKLLDVKLELLSDSARVLKSGDRVHFYYGASETLCRVSLLGVDTVSPGESCYAQLFFDEDVAIKKGDYYVIRYYSPVETIGGGTVLDASPRKHRRKDSGIVEALKIRESGDETAVLEQALKDASRDHVSPSVLAGQVGMSEASALEKLKTIEEEGRAVRLPNGVYLHIDYVNLAEETALSIINEYHQANALLSGMPKEELRSKLAGALRINDGKDLEFLMDLLIGRGKLEAGPNLIKSAGFKVSYTPGQQALMDRLAAAYEKAGFEPPETEELLSGIKDKASARQLLYSMAEEGRLTRISSSGFIWTPSLDEALDYIKNTIKETGSVTLAQVRDRMQTSRKYALAVLEYCDSAKITRLQGDVRVLY